VTKENRMSAQARDIVHADIKPNRFAYGEKFFTETDRT